MSSDSSLWNPPARLEDLMAGEYEVECASAWPMFAGLDVADVLVVSHSSPRIPSQSLHEAASDAVRGLLKSTQVARLLCTRRLILVARTAPGDYLGKSAVLRAQRRGLWESFDDEDLPAGERNEFPIEGSPGHFVGYVDVRPEDAMRSIEFTRTHFAICSAIAGDEAVEPLLAAVASCVSSRDLVQTFVASQAADGVAVFRAFGQFDDAEVSADLFVSTSAWESVAMERQASGPPNEGTL